MASPILPLISLPWVDRDGRATIPFGTYMLSVSQGNLPNFPTLVNAVNDAAAAAAGVPVGGQYRNGSGLMIRVT